MGDRSDVQGELRWSSREKSQLLRRYSGIEWQTTLRLVEQGARVQPLGGKKEVCGEGRSPEESNLCCRFDKRAGDGGIVKRVSRGFRGHRLLVNAAESSLTAQLRTRRWRTTTS